MLTGGTSKLWSNECVSNKAKNAVTSTIPAPKHLPKVGIHPFSLPWSNWRWLLLMLFPRKHHVMELKNFPLEPLPLPPDGKLIKSITQPVQLAQPILHCVIPCLIHPSQFPNSSLEASGRVHAELPLSFHRSSCSWMSEPSSLSLGILLRGHNPLRRKLHKSPSHMSIYDCLLFWSYKFWKINWLAEEVSQKKGGLERQLGLTQWVRSFNILILLHLHMLLEFEDTGDVKAGLRWAFRLSHAPHVRG